MNGMGTHRNERRHEMTSPDAVARTHRRWPLILIAAPAAVAVWSGWVGLGDLCGFGVVHPFPGIWDGFQLNTAITLPVGVESYGAYALTAWLVPGAPPAAREFAKRSAIGALALGCLGQVAYHLLAAANVARAPWLVTMAVACLPVVTLSFAAALTHLLRAGEATTDDATEATEATGEAIPEATVEPQVEAAKPVPVHIMDRPPVDATGEPSQEATQDATGEPSEATDGTPTEDAIGEPEPPATTEAIAEATTEPDGVPLDEPPGEPEAITPEPPLARPVRLVDDQDATAARAAYRKSVRTGRPLSDRKLGEQFGKGRTWGANRIKEVDGGPKLAKAQEA
jgi:hypothetical protein